MEVFISNDSCNGDNGDLKSGDNGHNYFAWWR